MATFSVVMLNMSSRRCQSGFYARSLVLKSRDISSVLGNNSKSVPGCKSISRLPHVSFLSTIHGNQSGLFWTSHSPQIQTQSFHRRLFGGLRVVATAPNPRFLNSFYRFESTKSTSDNPQTDNSSNEGSESKSSEEKPKKERWSWFRGKNSWKAGLVFLGGMFVAYGIALITTWGAPEQDPDGNEIKDEYSESAAVIAYLKRTWKEINIFKKKIQDPSREKLLPDPLKYPYMQPPYTLVIELTGVLIHPDWTYSTGWRFKKRPAIDYFLQNVGPPLFEVVIYSKEAGMTADPLVNHLDPNGFIMYRLYRDATRYQDGVHLKDISCLNREMSRIIMLDCSDDSVKLYPRNALVLKKWEGADEDRTLIDLAHFLKTIAASGVQDIRPVLDYYHQFEDPLTAFKDNQRKFEEEEKARAQMAAEDSKKKSWFSNFKPVPKS